MNYLPLKIWFIVSITPAIGALIVRLVWGVIDTPPVGSLVVIILVILLTLGIYTLLLYLTIRPSLEKLKSLLVRAGVTVIFTIGLIAAIFHFARFIPSPEAALPLNKVIATLLITAAISGYLLIMWTVWSIRKGGKG